MSTQTTTSGYLLLFRGTHWNNLLSPEETQEVMSRWTAWFDRLIQQEKAKAGQPLRNEGAIVSGKKGASQKIMTTTKSNSIQTVQPYLFFEGRCEEAIDFYRSALAAEVIMLMRFKDSPEPAMCAPESENKVLHASLRIGETTLMASDGRCQGKSSFQGFSLSLAVPNEIEAERLFASLAEGGEVQMPLTKTFFSPRFGMVTDRFGVSWMIIVPPEAK